MNLIQMHNDLEQLRSILNQKVVRAARAEIAIADEAIKL